MIYTGIGSRETPKDILELFEKLAMRAALDGDILRTGGADGADNAFLKGTVRGGGQIELYLPWANFNKDKIREILKLTPYQDGAVNLLIFNKPQVEAFAIAAYHHPAWQYMKQGGKKLHARNVHQVLGPNVEEPRLSAMVVCWTKDGKLEGGTAQALRVAASRDVPIINAGIEKDYELLKHRVYDHD